MKDSRGIVINENYFFQSYISFEPNIRPLIGFSSFCYMFPPCPLSQTFIYMSKISEHDTFKAKD